MERVHVKPCSNKLGIASIGQLEVGDIVVVSWGAVSDVDAGWTVNGDCTVALLEGGAL